jgi:hypothetical protein
VALFVGGHTAMEMHLHNERQKRQEDVQVSSNNNLGGYVHIVACN